MLKELIAPTLSRLFGCQCPMCGAPTVASMLCQRCRKQLTIPGTPCQFCNTPLTATARICGACLGQKHRIERLVTVSDFVGPWADLIKQFKYQKRLDLLRPLSHELLDQLTHSGLLERITQPHSSASPWRITAMPLHPNRQRQRGYNQAALLGKHLAQRLNVVFAEPAIRRRNTPPLEPLSRRQRQRAMRDVFECKAATGNWIIIDDVYTTGASTTALARCLQNAGAERIVALCLARTPHQRK